MGYSNSPEWNGISFSRNHLESCLREEQRTYNSQQLAQKLAVERQVTLSAGYLREVLEKRGSFGSEPDTLTMESKIQWNEPLSKQT